MPRRLPKHPLPERTFVSGRTPRPPPGWFDDVDVADHFAFGCDLFDAGCYFEAHELWESCWHAARARGDVDDVRLLRGLIHLAAAGVKLLDDKPESLVRHVERARALFAGITGRPRGLDAAALDAAAQALLRHEAPSLP